MRHDFFNVIDTEEKAYWLGFIVADGHIERTGTNSKRLSFTLQGADILHLQKLQNSLQSTYKVREKYDDNPRYKKPIHQAFLRISSTALCDRLIEIGFVPRKTGKEVLPCVPKHLRRHLIRGYIDGNGWVRKGNGLLGFVAGTEQVRDYICCHMHEELGVTFAVINESRKYNTTVFNCNLNKMRESATAISYLYSNATVFLDRKKIIADDILAKRNFVLPSVAVQRTNIDG